MNTDYQRSQKFWVFVKWDQHSTKRHKLNLGSMVINVSAIGCRFSFPATWVTYDNFSFKTRHRIATMERCQKWFTTRNSPLLNFKGNYHVQRSLPLIPIMDHTYPIQICHLILLIQTSVLSPNQYGAAQSVQWLGHKLEDLGFKSCEKQQNYLFSKTSRPAPAPTQPPTAAFSLQ